ncbi:DUF6069 family protein [Kitasatospora sp. NPDC085464]|uniref:DUF6069 family protein n=1 Tax=Kitasatospora sp. NPDC085464 TaxID=3364063 RepID=UPI0037C7FC54
MSAASPSPRQPAPRSTSVPDRLARATAVAVGLLANLLYMLVLTSAFGYHLKTPAVFGLPAQSVLVSLVSASSVVPTLLGWALLELLERFAPHRATVIWTVLAVLTLTASLPYNGAGISMADQFLLALMHLIVGVVVIPTFVITSAHRS